MSVIRVNMNIHCAQCKKPGAVSTEYKGTTHDTGLCMRCINKRLKEMFRNGKGGPS